MDLESRVMELESRLAFQDDTIQALNDVLVTQQRSIDRLELQIMVRRRWVGRVMTLPKIRLLPIIKSMNCSHKKTAP
jgi:hypothetical protein